jgi:transcriptional regulator with XRE-family HTH domain
MIVRFRSPERDRAIGGRVQGARRRQRRTQTDLAVLTGMSHSMLGKLERGERHWTLEAVMVTAQALGLPADFILGETIDDIVIAAPPGEPTPAHAAPAQSPAERRAADVLDLALLDETDRTMIVAMHAVMARRAVRMAA